MNAEQNERVKGFGQGMEDVAPERPSEAEASALKAALDEHESKPAEEMTPLERTLREQVAAARAKLVHPSEDATTALAEIGVSPPVTISTIGIRATQHLVNRAVKALRDAGRVPDADALKAACAATEDNAEKEREVWAVVQPAAGGAR